MALAGASVVPPARLPSTRRVPPALLGAVGIGLFLALWELAGRRGWFGPSWPPLSQVVEVLADRDQWGLYQRALSATLREAGLGYLIGVSIAMAMAAVAVVVPATAGPLQRLAAVMNAIPVIAVGPVLLVVVEDRSNGPIGFAAMAVFFTTFVATSSALTSVAAAQLDVLRVFGAGGQVRFWRLQLPAALPGIVDGLRLAAPAALLGAVLGEWFGAERGIGMLLVSSMQNLSIDRLWAAALLGAIVSMLAYGALSIVQRLVDARFRST